MTLPEYILGQMQQTLHSLQSDLHAVREEQSETAEKLDKLTAHALETNAWLKRLVMALGLWGASTGVTLSSDQLADLLVALLKRH